MTKNVVERIKIFNQDRIPQMVALKYKNMRADAFTFFRGTCHLFYEDWPLESALNTAPLTWICGDLHLENFGTYKGKNRLVYFDVNDFDEGLLAPCTWDAARFVTSLILAGPSIKLTAESTLQLCNHFLDTYFTTLTDGHIHSVERANATGLVKKLIRTLKSRSRDDFLDERSRKLKNTRKFKTDNLRYQPVSADEQEQVTRMIQELGERENLAAFYKVHDVAFRVAGTGSLGIKRYAVLVEGRGFPHENFILDVKEERASTLTLYRLVPQPKWNSEADRAVAVQLRFQGIHPALLTSAQMGAKAYIVKELQPSQDRINLAKWDGKQRDLTDLIGTMAQLLAWGELRSAGRSGSAIADELIDFGGKAALKASLLNYAAQYAKQVQKDYGLFISAYDDGALN